MARKKKRRTGVDAQSVLHLLRERNKPMGLPELLRGLHLEKKEKEALRHVLRELESSGKLIRTRKDAWGLSERMNLVTGKLEVQRSGVGFVICEDKRRRDIFINPSNFGDAWHGDRVVVSVTRERKGRNSEGRIVRVLERGVDEMPARVRKPLKGGLFLCEPTSPRYTMSFVVEPRPDDVANVEPGDIVILSIGSKADRNLWEGRIVKHLGREDSVTVQEDLVKASNGVPTVFPHQVVQEARALPPEPSEEDIRGRRDLRELGLVTIDGAKARDFDDAVCVQRNGQGYRLWVAIADVSHYVHPRSHLDREAYERGNSYYFPQSVEPMFPEALSNGLCSLNPDVDRLAMVAEMDFGPDARPGRAEFYPAVIRSHARLTYGQVNRALIEKDEEERRFIEPVLPMLEVAEELARKINAKRRKRGAIDFDLPEPEILFNIQGETLDIRPRVRHFGHQIIEEFMIAANEAVATFLEERDIPALYRIHPEADSDKVQALFSLLRNTELGPKVPEDAAPRDLQRLLEAADGTDMEFLVNRMMLRSMMQAKYSPANEGHFGLASESYAHFTSPIRRYADLVVHRALKSALGAAAGPIPGFKRLKDVGDHISARERVAMEAEREILKRLTILFLADKVGDEFTGVINSMADFGFWIELNEVMAEGMVRLSSLTDDYYAFLSDKQILLGERTGRAFRLGQTVRVVLEEVNLSRLEVNLRLVDASAESSAVPGNDSPEGGKRRPAGSGGKAGSDTRGARADAGQRDGKAGRKPATRKRRRKG